MKTIAFFLLWLLVMIGPWEGIFVIPGFSSGSKLLGALTAAAGLLVVLITGRLRFPLPLMFVGLFCGWCVLSATWAMNPEGALSKASTYLLLLTFTWLICQLADTPKRLKSLLRACLVGIAMMVVNSYVNYMHMGVAVSAGGEVRVAAETSNDNGMAHFCSIGILIAFYLATRREKSGFELPNWCYWTFIVAAGLAIPLTGSRAGVLSGGFVAFVLLAKVRKFTWKSRLALVVSLAIVAILIPKLVARSTLNRLSEGTEAGTFIERTTAWQYGLMAWTKTPILGIGPGSYADMMAATGYRRMVAHNTLISVLVESGLVGFTIYFLFWIIVVRRVLRLPKEEKFFWLSIIGCSLPIFLTGSMEYQKISWFVGAMMLSQTMLPSVPNAGPRRIGPAVARLSLRPYRPRPS